MGEWVTRFKIVGLLTSVVALAGCSLFAPLTTPLPTIPSDARLDCGPIVEEARCHDAVRVAITAQLNPPPIVEARIRRPGPGDDCLPGMHPCDASSIIVVLQSGDTLQEVTLVRNGNGWIRLDLIR